MSTHQAEPNGSGRRVSLHLGDLPAPNMGESASESPLHMTPGQIDGLEDIKAHDMGRHSRLSSGSNRGSLRDIRTSNFSSTAAIAMNSLQYLPTPLLVLSSLKTVLIANAAMARLLDCQDTDCDSEDGDSDNFNGLKGKTLSQIGVDMLQEGR